MNRPTNPLRVLQNVLHHLENSEDAKHQQVDGVGLAPSLALLRAWQAQRIARTYADLAEQPRYAPGLEFFLSDLYAPRDFSQRDHDIERAHELLSRFVPPALLKMLAASIVLNRLTYQLDHALLNALVNELGMKHELTGEMYAEAYRRCDNYEARVEQIRLIVTILKQADDAVRFPVTGAALNLARLPAEKSGWHEMYDFLVRGYGAFKKMKGAKEFIKAIETRETNLLERTFAGEKNPFD